MGSCLHRSKKPASADDASELEDLSRLNPDLAFRTIFPEALEKQTMSILLVFAQDDKQCLSFQQAAKLASYKCNVVKSMDLILPSCVEYSPNVIIVDTRQTNQIESLCTTFSMLHNRECLVLVAVQEFDCKTYDVEMLPLLKVGFTRQFLENLNVNVCLMELLCIEHGELQNRFQFQMAHSFLAAVEICTDSIEITNAKSEIVYINSSFERVFGFTKKEALGKTFLTLTGCKLNTDETTIEIMKSQMQQGMPWKGIINVCKKDKELCSHRCHLIPILGQSGHVQNFAVIRNEVGDSNLAFSRTGSVAVPVPGRGREGSTRFAMTIEAPLTRVIHMISSIQATCPRNVAESLDNVLEVLRSSELYFPIKTENLDNEMTAELLEGLMTAPTMRRSTATIAEIRRRSIVTGSTFCPKLPEIGCSQLPLKAQAILNKESKWEFNIIELEKITEKKPLQFLCMKTFERFKVAEFLKIDQGTLHQWFRVIESHYHSTISYHNSTHAGDVLHAAAYFLSRDILKDMMAIDEKVSVLIAAVVHDLDHPGKTNSYLINSNSYMAQLYNDLSVLESHHVSYAFRLTQQDASINIFKNLHREEYRGIRHQIIDMVLATEMSKHLEHLSRFMHTIVGRTSTSEMFARRMTGTPSGGVDNNTIVKRMLIKCADVSNSARPRQLSIAWAERISEEYFQQTDDEKAKGLPVVMPLFDRRICNIAKSQLSFMNLFIVDMFEVWHGFCKIPDLVEQVQSNYEYWKEQESLASSEEVIAVNPDSSAVPKTAV